MPLIIAEYEDGAVTPNYLRDGEQTTFVSLYYIPQERRISAKLGGPLFQLVFKHEVSQSYRGNLLWLCAVRAKLY